MKIEAARKELDEVSFKEPTSLVKTLKEECVKQVLLVIPAISGGGEGLHPQFIDYLENGAKVYRELTARKFDVKIFLHGAEHRNEGFLREKAKRFIQETHKIPDEVFVGDDEFFRFKGLLSVEEVELFNSFLDANPAYRQHAMVTINSSSQLMRYFLHQKGFGVNSLYYVINDKSNYTHLEANNLEDKLIEVALIDPRFEGPKGKVIRYAAIQKRKPGSTVKVEVEDVVSWLEKLKIVKAAS